MKEVSQYSHWVPVELCAYALKHKIINPFQLYLYLNTRFSGKFRMDMIHKKEIANDLKLKTYKTIDNRLDRLLSIGWIIYSKATKLYYVKGFERLSIELKFKSQIVARLEVNQIIVTPAFSMGVVITNQINYQKRKRVGRDAEPIKSTKIRLPKTGSSKRPLPLSYFYPISCVILGKILDMSPKSAQRYKHLAGDAGFIDIQQILEPLKLDVRHYHYYKRLNPEEHVRIKNNMLYLQKADWVSSNMTFKRKKKSKTLY